MGRNKNRWCMHRLISASVFEGGWENKAQHWSQLDAPWTPRGGSWGTTQMNRHCASCDSRIEGCVFFWGVYQTLGKGEDKSPPACTARVQQQPGLKAPRGEFSEGPSSNLRGKQNRPRLTAATRQIEAPSLPDTKGVRQEEAGHVVGVPVFPV